MAGRHRQEHQRGNKIKRNGTLLGGKVENPEAKVKSMKDKKK